MISTFSLFLIITLIFAIIAIAIAYFISLSHSSKINNFARSRGVNMNANETKKLQCENGRVICVYRATEVCTSGQQFETPSTDPMSDGSPGTGTYGNFNPNTTISKTSELKNMCNGKTSCEYTFTPSSPSSPCAGNSQLIGTYACLVPGSDCQSYD